MNRISTGLRWNRLSRNWGRSQRRRESVMAFAVLVAVSACASRPAAKAAPESTISNRAEPVVAGPETTATPRTAAEKQQDRDQQAVGAALVALERMASEAASAGGNCDAMVEAVSSSIYSEMDLWVELQEISSDPDREVALITAEQPLGEGMQRFADALGECAFDRRMRESLEAMTFASSGTP